MKNSNFSKPILGSFLALGLIVFTASCNKDAITALIPTVTIGNVTTDISTMSDVQTLSCQLPDTIDMAMVPTTLTNYVASNYAGYTTQFVYAIKSNGTLTGYLANLVNGTQHTNARFDATGTFVKAVVLPTHTGFAMFQTDTIATSLLPLPLTAYLAANSGTYKFQRAFMEADSSFTTIVTQGTTAYALLYAPKVATTGLTIINLGTIDFTTPNPAISSLPSAINDYMTQNYPSATIERVMTGSCTGANNGYTVIFKNNGTQYAAEFDTNGLLKVLLQAK
jgi:hypothetical protein